jgi:hypothetical protein
MSPIATPHTESPSPSVVGIISNCLLTGLARTFGPLPIGDSCRGMWHRARLIGLAPSYDKDRFVYAEGLP